MSVTDFASIAWSDTLTLFINGSKISLKNPDPSELLSTYLREDRGLKGTKVACGEGGCGACSVVLKKKNEVIAVNSCMRFLCANDGLAITTVEGIGSVRKSLSSEQKILVASNGSQCGFCTPGWITTMRALNESIESKENASISLKELEAYFDGNMCRCTGYKPIIDAFSNYCSAPCGKACGSGSCTAAGVAEAGGCCADLEDVIASPSHTGASKGPGTKSRSLCVDDAAANEFVGTYEPAPLLFFNPATGKRWVRPLTLTQLSAALKEYSEEAVQLVVGNTSVGVTKYLNDTAPYHSSDNYSVFIDVSCIPQLISHGFDKESGELSIGAATSISNLIALLRQSAKAPATTTADSASVDNSSAFSVAANHLTLVANTQVRNAGSWAGNLMIYLRYQNFPSDVAIAFAVAQARLQVFSNTTGAMTSISMQEFLALSLEEFEKQELLIVSVVLKEAPTDITGDVSVVSETFKVAQRNRNAHAHVNAAFQFAVKPATADSEPPLCANAIVVFGGVSSKTFFASKAMAALSRAPLNNATLRLVLAGLREDLAAVGPSHEYGNQAFRESVMEAFVYRAFLRCYPAGALAPTLTSAVAPWSKPTFSGTCDPLVADTRAIEAALSDETAAAGGAGAGESKAASSKTDRHIGKAVPKLDAYAQATGEQSYVTDESMSSRGLFGALVYSSRCAQVLISLDTRPALNMAGVEIILIAADIPGKNLINRTTPLLVAVGEKVMHVGAPLAVVLAKTEAIANAAAALVRVIYGDEVEKTGGSEPAPLPAAASAAAGDAVAAAPPAPPAENAPPITNLKQSMGLGAFVPLPPIPGITFLTVGDAPAALGTAARRAKGTVSAAGQHHFYMEAQAAVATLVDGEYVDIVCGSQALSENQTVVAAMLGLPENKVILKCPRLGGAFGGKFSRNLPVVGATALAAYITGKPVRIVNNRNADMNMNAGRESYAFDYEVGFSEDGRISALTIDVYVDAGADCEDAMGGLFLGLESLENAYFLPNFSASAKICVTNTPPRTYMRAPGIVQTCFAMECVLERIAAELDIPLASVQELNFIEDGKTTVKGDTIKDCNLPVVWSTLKAKSDYHARFAAAQAFNATNKWRKRGVAMSPVRYTIGWNMARAGIRLGVRTTDGTVTIAHNGIDMGQGIHTKVAQLVAHKLGIDVGMIRVTATATDKVVNGGFTGGSFSSETVCMAAINACETLLARIAPHRKGAKAAAAAATAESAGETEKKDKAGDELVIDTAALSAASTATAAAGDAPVPEEEEEDWATLIASLPSEVALNVEGWYAPSANPSGTHVQYYVWAACCSEVELDVLTGNVHVLLSEIVYDCGQSLNPAVDMGQIEGAFIMGLGYMLTESVEFDSKGTLLTNGTWEYKPPMVQDIPSSFNVTILPNLHNKDGVLGSKATGEPPLIIAYSIYFAVKMAIASSRADAGVKGPFDLDLPCTVDLRQQAALVSAERLALPF